MTETINNCLVIVSVKAMIVVHLLNELLIQRSSMCRLGKSWGFVLLKVSVILHLSHSLSAWFWKISHIPLVQRTTKLYQCEILVQIFRDTNTLQIIRFDPQKCCWTIQLFDVFSFYKELDKYLKLVVPHWDVQPCPGRVLPRGSLIRPCNIPIFRHTHTHTCTNRNTHQL